MKLFGSLRELVRIAFRQNSQEIELDSNTGTTYTATRLIQLPPGDTDHTLVSATSTQTLTGKTIDGDDNTVQDLALSSLKTQIGNANKAIRRDSSGIVVSGPVTISDAGAIAAATQLDVDNIRVDGNTISSTDSNGNIILDANGTGVIRAQDALEIRDNKTILLYDDNSSNFNILKVPSNLTSNNTITFPEAAGAVVIDSAIQTLTNKTISGGSNTLSNIALTSLDTQAGDADKVLRRNASGVVVAGPVTATSTGVVAGITQLDVGNLSMITNTISSTNTNGNIILDPTGTGLTSVIGFLKSDTGLQLEETGAGTDTITIQAPASIAANYTLTLPIDDGTSSQVLQTDGSGVLSWATVATNVNTAINTVNDADYTVTTVDGYRTVNVTNVTATRTINLPAVASSNERILTIGFQSGSAGKIIIDGNASETIDGFTTITLWEAGDSVTIQCNGSVWLVIQSKMIPRTSHKLSSGAGLGATATRIQYFTNTDINTGLALTKTNDSTSGASFTAVHPGVYSVSYGSRRAGGTTSFGISLNASTTTDSSSLTGANLLTYAETTTAGQVFTTACTVRLAVGDVIRAHTDSNNSGTSDARTQFIITQVEKFYA